MNPDGHIIPMTEDDQGEGVKDPLTIDDLFEMGFLTYKEGQAAFEGKFERPGDDWPKQKSQKDNVKPIKAFFGRKM